MSKIFPEFVPDFEICKPAGILTCNMHRFSVSLKGTVLADNPGKKHIMTLSCLIRQNNMSKIFVDVGNKGDIA
jgi:hypothetical protein